MNETPIRIFKSKKKNEILRTNRRGDVQKWQAALIRLRKPKPFAELEEHDRKAWIAAAKAAYKEFLEMH